MKLSDATNARQIEDALELGDEELERSIEDQVQILIDHQLYTARPMYEWNETWSGSPALQEQIERSGLKRFLLSVMAELHPELFAEIPRDRLLEKVAEEVAKENLRFASGGAYGGSDIVDFTDMRGPEGAVGVMGEIVEEDQPALVIGHTTIELSIPIVGALGLVPLEHLVGVAEESEPSDADWGLWYASVRNRPRPEKMLGGIVESPMRSVVAQVEYDDIHEWLVDQRQAYFSDVVDESPDKAVKLFLDSIKAREPDLHKRIKKAKLPKDVLSDYAVEYLQDPVEGIVLIREAMGLWGYEGTRGDPILEIDQDALRRMGITSGRFWDGAPWTLLNLPPAELAYEGTLQRHCVGRHDMGYRDAVESGKTQIWSLRSAFNRPLLTFEVDMQTWNLATTPTERAAAIEQIKGKLNRFAGETPEEAAVVEHIFDVLDVEGAIVDDFRPARVANPRAPRRTFDQPYQPRQAGAPRSELARYSALKRKLMR